MSSCGAFYGRLDSLVSTPTSQAVGHSSRSSSTDSSRSANSPSVTRVTPGSTPMNISRANTRALEHKVDQLLDAIEEQKKENSEILLQLKSLQNAVDWGGERATRKVNKKIPYSLSEKVREIHERADRKFDGSQLYHAEINQNAKEHLLEQLNMSVGDQHSPKRLKRAVHRFFESQRRLFNDDQPGRVEAANATKKNSKQTALRKQLYERRGKYLKYSAEKEKWPTIDYCYMTEESPSESEDVIRQHKLTWRSQELNRLVRKLDKRRRKKAKRGFRSKPREVSTPSQSQPPNDYAEWAVTLNDENGLV